MLLSVYTREDFDRVSFHKLNSDQNLAFLQNLNFVAGAASKEKVIQCLYELSRRKKDIKIFERPEIISTIKSIALNPRILNELQPRSYVATFLGAAAAMKIDDHEIWSSLAAYVSTIMHELDFRSLSSICYSFYKASQGKPVMLNFDDLFTELELPIIKRLDQTLHISEMCDPKGISTLVMSYGKTQNGSVQFF